MNCPKCLGELSAVFQGVTNVDRCGNCQGLFFDQLTQALLEAVMVQAGTIDLGKGEKDSAFDDMVYVECPKCDKIMDQRLIEEPNRIRFELCPTCNATFLDAGELREYISPRFIEDFKSLLPE